MQNTHANWEKARQRGARLETSSIKLLLWCTEQMGVLAASAHTAIKLLHLHPCKPIVVHTLCDTNLKAWLNFSVSCSCSAWWRNRPPLFCKLEGYVNTQSLCIDLLNNTTGCWMSKTLTHNTFGRQNILQLTLIVYRFAHVGVGPFLIFGHTCVSMHSSTWCHMRPVSLSSYADIVKYRMFTGKCMQMTKLSKIISCFTKSSVSSSTMHSTLRHHPDNFQAQTLMSFQ